MPVQQQTPHLLHREKQQPGEEHGLPQQQAPRQLLYEKHLLRQNLCSISSRHPVSCSQTSK